MDGAFFGVHEIITKSYRECLSKRSVGMRLCCSEALLRSFSLLVECERSSHKKLVEWNQPCHFKAFYLLDTPCAQSRTSCRGFGSYQVFCDHRIITSFHGLRMLHKSGEWSLLLFVYFLSAVRWEYRKSRGKNEISISNTRITRETNSALDKTPKQVNKIYLAYTRTRKI